MCKEEKSKIEGSSKLDSAIDTTAIRSDLQRAVLLHQSGELAQAGTIYKRILDVDPKNGDALHLLGLVSHQSGQSANAITLIKRALKISPNQPDFLCNLADILRESGQFKEAARVYQYVIQLQPESAEMYTILGLTLKDSMQFEEAVRAYRQAIKINPVYDDVYNHLGNVLQEQGKLEESIQVYHKAIALNSEQAEVYNNLGNALQKQDKLEESIQAYHKAIELNPEYAEAHNNLGNALQRQDKLEESIQAYHQAIGINPEYAEVYNSLGIALQKQDKLEESIQAYHKAIGINPEHAEAYNSLGNALQKQGNLEESIQVYHRAIALNPEYAQAFNNLGNALQKQDKLEEAIQAYHKAIELNPEYTQAFNSFGEALRRLGEFQPAIRAYQKALDTDPNYAIAHNNLGLVLLLIGDFERGWREYEWRWQCPTSLSRNPNFPQPYWKGQGIDGKTILVWGEQGIGDRIMYASLLGKLQKQANRVLVEVDNRLLSIFQRSFSEIDFFSTLEAPHPYLLGSSIDYQSPFANLVQWLIPNEESFPKDKNYLKACASRVKDCRDKYQQLAQGRLLIGISWKSVNKDIGKLKSTSLIQWKELLLKQDCFFLNLQYGEVDEEINTFTAQTGISIYRDEDIDSLKDLDDFAAQVSALDLIISTSNTTVHMAGALGKPVWTLLSYVPDWRWQLERSDTLWYPSMTLYRQPVLGDWGGVFQKIQLDLEKFVIQNLGTKSHL